MITVENCMITCIFILTSCSNDLIHDKYIQLATANWSFRVGVFPSAWRRVIYTRTSIAKGKRGQIWISRAWTARRCIMNSLRPVVNHWLGVEGFWLCKINDIPRYWRLIGSQFFNCPPLYSAGDNWSPLRSPKKNNVIPKSIFPHPFPSKDLKVAKSLTDCYGLIIQDWDCVTQSLQMW